MKDKEINNFIRETGKMGDIWTKEQVIPSELPPGLLLPHGSRSCPLLPG